VERGHCQGLLARAGRSRERLAARRWLKCLVRRTPGLVQAVVASADDGRLIIAWPWRPTVRAAWLAAVRLSQPSPTGIASSRITTIPDDRGLQDLRDGYVVMLPLDQGLCLKVLVSPSCEMGSASFIMLEVAGRLANIPRLS
jgi:predicted regulator of Ras-like GTPase activity (Roadblock/LC7/MglB family)